MDALVLSCAYEAITRVHWQRAMTLLVSGRVEMVEPYEALKVRSASQTWTLPAVLRFPKALRWRSSGVRFCRDNIFLRDQGRCQYCQCPLTAETATLDHVQPRSRGGKTCWTNVVIACRRCNHRKANQTPREAGMHLCAAPMEPKHLPGAKWGALYWEHGMPDQWRPYLRIYQSAA